MLRSGPMSHQMSPQTMGVPGPGSGPSSLGPISSPDGKLKQHMDYMQRPPRMVSGDNRSAAAAAVAVATASASESVLPPQGFPQGTTVTPQHLLNYMRQMENRLTHLIRQASVQGQRVANSLRPMNASESLSYQLDTPPYSPNNGGGASSSGGGIGSGGAASSSSVPPVAPPSAPQTPLPIDTSSVPPPGGGQRLTFSLARVNNDKAVAKYVKRSVKGFMNKMLWRAYQTSLDDCPLGDTHRQTAHNAINHLFQKERFAMAKLVSDVSHITTHPRACVEWALAEKGITYLKSRKRRPTVSGKASSTSGSPAGGSKKSTSDKDSDGDLLDDDDKIGSLDGSPSSPPDGDDESPTRVPPPLGSGPGLAMGSPMTLGTPGISGPLEKKMGALPPVLLPPGQVLPPMNSVQSGLSLQQLQLLQFMGPGHAGGMGHPSMGLGGMTQAQAHAQVQVHAAQARAQQAQAQAQMQMQAQAQVQSQAQSQKKRPRDGMGPTPLSGSSSSSLQVTSTTSGLSTTQSTIATVSSTSQSISTQMSSSSTSSQSTSTLPQQASPQSTQPTASVPSLPIATVPQPPTSSPVQSTPASTGVSATEGDDPSKRQKTLKGSIKSEPTSQGPSK